MRPSRSDWMFYGVVAWTVIATTLIVVRSTGGRASTSAAAAAAAATQPRHIANPQRFASRGFVRGPASAPVTIVIFSDFQCPFCRRFAGIVDSLHSSQSDVRIIERHYPLDGLHPEAFQAAIAAECARDQTRYDSMRATLYAQQQLLRDERWGEIGLRAGVPDTNRLVKCIAREDHADLVKLDVAAGHELGVQGTPTIVIADSVYPGGMDYESFAARVSAARARRP